MKIASWNVNSIRARIQNVLSWIAKENPDVLLLQEIKCENNDFPYLEFSSLGYKCHALGQKSYNGVAILSRYDIEDPVDGLPTFSDDPNARYIDVIINNMIIASVYAPNGNPIGTEKFDYKLKWTEAFLKRAKHLLNKNIPVIFGGDFNVVPTSLDVCDLNYLAHDAVRHEEVIKQYRKLTNNGYTDIFRALNPNAKEFTFWDYKGNAWGSNKGIRLDYFFLSSFAVDITESCYIDKSVRALEKASDHVPIVLEICKI